MLSGSNFYYDKSASNKAPTRNPTFAYPPNNIEFLDAQRNLDHTGSSRAGKYARGNFKLTRGFIKNLQPATVKSMPVSTCYFQFNPQEIRQSVSMREDIYNPILLTAEQLSQPIGGNVTFQFDLFFDRSQELAGNTRGALPGDLENAIGADSAGPEQVGVYADLRVLYDVIGQGVNEGLIELQRENLKSAYSAKLKRDSAYSSPSDEEDGNTDTTTQPADATSFDSAEVSNVLNANVGNRAFLIPNPVRIAFSKMLMVDGFVTGTNVDFLKFNTDMIPMQCRVSLSVYAMYIGFAKQKTFLTSTMEEARRVLTEEAARDAAALTEIEAALMSNVIRPFRMSFGMKKSTTPSYRTDWDDAIQNGNVPFCELYYYLMPNPVIYNEGDSQGSFYRVGFTGFPGIRPNAGGGKDTDPILALFEDPNRSQFTISYDWGFTIYGKQGQNDSNGTGWTQSQATAALSNLGNAEIVGRYSGSETATSKDGDGGKGGWGSGTSGSGVARERIRRRSYHGNEELTNNGSYILNFDGTTRRNNIKNSYYVVEYTFSISVQTGNAERTYGTIPFKVAVRGDGKTGIQTQTILNPYSTTTVYFTKQAG